LPHDLETGENKLDGAFVRLVLLLIAFVVVVNFATMPAEEYRGDAMAVRVETTGLLNRGQWAVSPDVAQQLGVRGQYFYQKANGVFYPKYGLLNTLIYAPCLWLEKIVTGHLTVESDNTLCLNLFNIVLSCATAAYLALLARRHTRSNAITSIFVIASLYSTFWWNYLRAQTFEIYVTLFLVAFYYHFVSAWNCRQPQRRHRQFLIAALYLGFLCLSKTVYVALLPVIIAFFALTRRRREDRPGSEIKNRFAGSLRFFWLPMAIFLCILLAANDYKFGSPFSTGYSQWSREAQPFTANILPALIGFVASKQGSLFLHFPVLLFALIGWPIFFKKHRAEAGLILSLGAVLLLINSAFTNWRGESCYGPRYLLPVAPLLGLPFVNFLSWTRGLQSKIGRWTMGGVAAASLTYSLVLQIAVNSLPFFFWYDLKAVIKEKTPGRAEDYLRSHQFGTINIDFVRYAAGSSSRFRRDFVSQLEPGQFVALEGLKMEMQLNYYWFPTSVEALP
jgi:hypothetical protein